MQIATWNVNGLRARSMRLMEWLAERQPDIACLQELKLVEEEFPFLEIRAAGYHAVIAGQQAWNGVAVLSKERPEVISRELDGAGQNGARFVVAKVAGIEVASLYAPNGKSVSHPDFKMKLAWFDRLATYVESRADRAAPFFLGGDFNVNPTDLDSYGGVLFHGKSHHTAEERALLPRLEAAGLVDLFRQRYPTEPGYSWWDYRAGSFHKNLGMRMDLLLATPALADRVDDVFVDREFRKKGKSGSIASDHAPVVAVLR